MKLTQKIIDKIQEAMYHTKRNGDINWDDGDEIDVNLAGTFAADRFIVIVNRTKSSTSKHNFCLLYTSPSPRDRTRSRMPSSA